MPKVQYINEGFTAGEISQELQGRVSSDLYKESVHIMEDMVPTIQGAAVRRPGSKFLAEVSQQNAESGHRLIPYRISASRSVMFHAGPNTLTAYDQAGAVTAAGAGTGVVINKNPNFFDQLNDWVERNFTYFGAAPADRYYWSAGADVSWDALRPSALFRVISALFIPNAALVQSLTLLANTQYELHFLATSPTPKAAPTVPNLTPGIVRVVTVTNPTNFFPANDSYVTGVLATLPYSIDNQTGTVLFTTPNWGAPTVVHLEIQLGRQGSTPGLGFAGVFGIDSHMTTCKVTQMGLPPGPVSFPSPWAGKDIHLLSFAQTPEFPSKLILAHPDVATQQIIYTPATDTWTLAAITFVSPPWAAGEFPGTVAVHSGRLVLASSKVRPERVWFSKVLSYFDFGLGTGLIAEAFFGDLSEPGRVLWMRSMWSLVVGAESGLWDISALTGVALGPGNSRSFKHQAHHSSNTAPAFTNNEVAYIAEGGRRMYSARREGEQNTYVDKELSFTARHMAASGFRDIAWAEFPYNTLWSSASEIGLGTLVAATYEPKLLAMAGWHRHNVGGAVHAVGTINVGGVDQVFLLVGRIKGSTSYLSIERFDWSTYLDASILRTFAVATNVITGLGHLEGAVVYALDSTGIVHGPFTVVSATITLLDAVTSVVVGVSFRSKIVTNRPEGLSPSGTAQGLKKNWNKIFVRVAPGSRPLINGSRAPDRDPATPMNLGQGPAYEDIEVSTLGWTKDGTITIEEFLPVPLTIAAVFGHVTAEIL